MHSKFGLLTKNMDNPQNIDNMPFMYQCLKASLALSLDGFKRLMEKIVDEDSSISSEDKITLKTTYKYCLIMGSSFSLKSMPKSVTSSKITTKKAPVERYSSDIRSYDIIKAGDGPYYITNIPVLQENNARVLCDDNKNIIALVMSDNSLLAKKAIYENSAELISKGFQINKDIIEQSTYDDNTPDQSAENIGF